MNISKKILLLTKNTVVPYTSTADIEAMSGLNALFVAVSPSDFTLSGNDVVKWKDRSVNHNDISASGILRTFDSVGKKVINLNINGNTPFANTLNYGNGDYTVIVYESFVYRNASSSFVMDNYNYIGETIGSSYVINENSAQSTFSKGIIPAGIRKHFIRKSSGIHTWVRNGELLTRTSNQNGIMTISNLGTDYGLVCLGSSNAYVFFNRSLADEEINIVKNNLDKIFG